MDNHITYAPWTPEQVEILKSHQELHMVHPYTHDCGTVLRPTANGWVCDDIGCCADEQLDKHPCVVQDWYYTITLQYTRELIDRINRIKGYLRTIKKEGSAIIPSDEMGTLVTYVMMHERSYLTIIKTNKDGSVTVS